MKDYIELAKRTEAPVFNVEMDEQFIAPTKDQRLMHAGFGMVTEAAEFMDQLKRHVFYGKDLDETNLKEELGDMLWYMAIAMDALGTDFDAEEKRNIAKLQARYPEKFDGYLSENRDLDKEREILEDR